MLCSHSLGFFSQFSITLLWLPWPVPLASLGGQGLTALAPVALFCVVLRSHGRELLLYLFVFFFSSLPTLGEELSSIPDLCSPLNVNINPLSFSSYIPLPSFFLYIPTIFVENLFCILFLRFIFPISILNLYNICNVS